MNNEVVNNHEIEYKFITTLPKEVVHNRLETIFKRKLSPKHVISCDDYYLKYPDRQKFIRYRKGDNKKELTLKFKKDENIVRKEINLDIAINDDMTVTEFLVYLGYKKEFSVFKESWIYHFEKHEAIEIPAGCEVAYYVLSDGRAFIEIEAINYLTIEEGLKTINWFMNALDLDLTQRTKKSLFELFMA